MNYKLIIGLLLVFLGLQAEFVLYKDLVLVDDNKAAILDQLQASHELDNAVIIESLLIKLGEHYANLLNLVLKAKQDLLTAYLTHLDVALLTVEPLQLTGVVGMDASLETITPAEVKIFPDFVPVGDLKTLVSEHSIGKIPDNLITGYEAMLLDPNKAGLLEKLGTSNDLDNLAIIESLLIKLGEYYANLLNLGLKAKQDLLAVYLAPLDVALPTTPVLDLEGVWQIFDHPTVDTKPLGEAERDHYIDMIASEFYKSFYLNQYFGKVLIAGLYSEKMFLQGNKFEIVVDPTDEYLVSFIMPSILEYSEEEQQKILNKALRVLMYWEMERIPLQEAQKIVQETFGKIAPGLYEIFNQGNVLKEHVKLASTIGIGAEVSYSETDGLPIIALPNDSFELSFDELVFIMGHELSHYINFDADRPGLSEDIFTPQGNNQLNFKITKPLDFKDAFQNASSRIREYDADRSSVLDFGTSPDAGIAWLSRKSSYKNTFGYTHPQARDRIEQLTQLKYDIEMGNIKVRAPINFDWLDLAQEYKTRYSSLKT